MSKEIEGLVNRLIQLYQELPIEKRREICHHSLKISHKYKRLPWVADVVLTNRNGGKYKSRVIKSIQLVKALEAVNLKSIMMFLECYNKVMQTEKKIEFHV